jgi:Tfp pilus assembly protein PilO
MIRNLIALTLVAAAILIFMFYTKPAYDSVQALSAQGAQYQAALSKAAQLQQLKQSLLSKYNSFDPNQVSRLNTLLPDQVDNIRLILDLDNLAGRFGMSVQNVNISTPGSNGASSGSVVGSIATEAQPYSALTIQFTTSGTYEQFSQFLDALQSSLRLVDLESLDMSAGGAGGSLADPTFAYSLTVQTYWLR